MLLAQYSKHVRYLGCELFKNDSNHCSCIDILLKKDYNPNDDKSFSVNKQFQIDEYFQPVKEEQLQQPSGFSVLKVHCLVAVNDGFRTKILKPPAC